MRALVFAVGASLMLFGPLPVKAAPANRIDIAYVAPKNPEHQGLVALLRERRALERIRTLLGPFRLPRRLLIKTEGCDGDSNAWYEEGAITICYEYLADILRNAPADVSPAGVTRTDATVGPFFDVVLHEFGHALFDLLKVPLFGREEDAADQISGYLMLRFPKDERRRLIVGAAYSYTREFAPEDVKPVRTDFADEHGTPEQRFYNLLCIAYGADKEAFADFVAKKYLPEARAEGCADEYKAVVRAFRVLIGPHLDRRRANKLRAVSWLPAAETTLPRPVRAKR